MHSKFPIQDTKDTTLTHAKGGRGKLAPLSSPLQKHLLMTGCSTCEGKARWNEMCGGRMPPLGLW